MLSRREIHEKDLQVIMAKPIGNKNPIFDQRLIEDLHSMFSLYADSRQRRVEIRDILLTASTLGLEHKHEFVYRALVEIDEANQSQALDFEGFITELSKKIVTFFSLFRVTHSQRRVDKPTSFCLTDMERENLTSLT